MLHVQEKTRKYARFATSIVESLSTKHVSTVRQFSAVETSLNGGGTVFGPQGQRTVVYCGALFVLLKMACFGGRPIGCNLSALTILMRRRSSTRPGFTRVSFSCVFFGVYRRACEICCLPLASSGCSSPTLLRGDRVLHQRHCPCPKGEHSMLYAVLHGDVVSSPPPCCRHLCRREYSCIVLFLFHAAFFLMSSVCNYIVFVFCMWATSRYFRCPCDIYAAPREILSLCVNRGWLSLLCPTLPNPQCPRARMVDGLTSKERDIFCHMLACPPALQLPHFLQHNRPARFFVDNGSRQGSLTTTISVASSWLSTCA